MIDQLHRDVCGGKTTWWFVFNGKRIDFTTAKLLSQHEFTRTVFRAVQQFPPRRAPDNYDTWLDNLTRNCVIHETADPLQKGRRK